MRIESFPGQKEDLEHVFTHTRMLWEELRGARIFISGGTGFFGCWLISSFLEANDRLNLHASITVLTRNVEAFRQKMPNLSSHAALDYLQGDVRSFAFPSRKYSYVIHAATDTNKQIGEAQPLLLFDTIVQGTRRMLDFSVECGARKLLFTSSGAVYGTQPADISRQTEESSIAPEPTSAESVYGEGKRAAELLCAVYATRYSLETKICRCYAFAGPYLPLDQHFAIGNFIRDGLTGDSIKVQGDGTPYRSYLYAADLAIWLWTILINGKSCRPYNVGSEVEISIRDLAEQVACAFAPCRSVTVERMPTTGVPRKRYVPSTKRARDELGLKQYIDLPQAIARTIRSFSSKYRID